ncbi:MAG: hypothetical protein V1734_00095 [Nanoarchaeota archaeon]
MTPSEIAQEYWPHAMWLFNHKYIVLAFAGLLLLLYLQRKYYTGKTLPV